MTEERSTFRHTIGLIAVVGGLLSLVPLYFVPIPEENKEPLLLAIGLVLGWGGAVLNGEWGSSPAGRAAATIGLRNQDAPSGRPNDPISVDEVKP